MVIARAAVGRPVYSGERLASLDLAQLDPHGAERLELVFVGVKKTAGSMEVRVSFGSRGSGTAEAGSLYTYGEGSGEAQTGGDRFEPMRLSLDVTEALRKVSADRKVEVRIKLLDYNGREAKEPLVLEAVELHQEP